MNLYNWLNSLFLLIPSVTAEKVKDFLMALQLKTIYRVGLMEVEEKGGRRGGGRGKRRAKRKIIFFYTRHRKSEAFAEQAGICPLKNLFRNK